MADNTNYIGVAMGMDVTDLKAGLSEANKQIQLANAEFRSASSTMDDWTKSTEGITAKVKQLDTILGAQKSKLAGLNAEYKETVKKQGENSEAARKLQIQIKNQEAVVNKTEKEYKNYKETLEQAEAGTLDLEKVSLRGGKAVEKMGDSAKEAGDEIQGNFGEKVSKGITVGIAAIGAAAVATAGSILSLAESTREARENFNKLETAFTTAEHTAEDAKNTYNELYGVLGDEGQATEAAAHLAQLAKSQEDLSKWTNIATGVYATFGDSLPIENLTEAANETAKTGTLTGGLADALNWAGESEEKFQEKLDAATSEQERQALITETLNGLYSEQSAKFKDLNSDIIKARKADAELAEVMADLGEAVEPVNTQITEFKSELAKEFAPILKKDVIPATEEFFDRLEDTKAVEKAGKAFSFLVKNLDTIAATTVTLLGVWKTFTAAMAIANTVSAASKAMSAYTTAVGFATKAQVAFNAAQKANLFGAIASLALTAISAIATYALTNKDAAKEQDNLTKEQREAVNTAKELSEAYKETEKEAKKLAAQESANITYTSELWKELQKLTDENGKVKEGYEGRADFILNELNEALGTEYKQNDGIITQYGEMVKSIDDLIAAKRAEILLQAYEETYTQAIQNRIEAEKARGALTLEIVAQQEEVEKAQLKAKEARLKYEEALEQGKTGRYLELLESQMIGYQNVVGTEKDKLKEKEQAYNENETQLREYYSNISAYQEANTLILEGKTEEGIQVLERLAGGFKTVESTAKLGAKEQKKVLEQQVIDTEINARLMKEAYEDGVEGVTEEMVDTAQEQADTAKEEFKAVGGNITKGIAEGAEDESWTLSGAMESIINKGLEAARNAAIIESPSKLFRKQVGRYIGQGVGVGVLDSIPEVKKDIKKFNDFLVENIGENGGIAELSAGIATSGMSARGAKRTVTSTGGNPETSKSTIVNAGMTVNYNGKLSRRELKRLENDNYTAIRTRLRTEGAI